MHGLYCEGIHIKTVNTYSVSITKTQTEHMDMVPGCLLLAAYLSATAWMGKNIPCHTTIT